MRIKADIPCFNVTSNRYNTLASVIVYVNNDIKIPHVTNEHPNNKKNLTVGKREWGAEIVIKSTDRLFTIALFLPVQDIKHGCLTALISREIKWICFNNICLFQPSRIIKIAIYSVDWKLRGDHNCRLFRVLYILNCTVYNHIQDIVACVVLRLHKFSQIIPALVALPWFHVNHRNVSL